MATGTTERCMRCRGTGTVDIDATDGSGDVYRDRCPDCAGTGWVDWCDRCGGEGEIVQLYSPGSGLLEVGHMTCDRCGGSGWMSAQKPEEGEHGSKTARA